MSRLLWCVPLIVACGPKKAPEPTGPIEGWHQEEGWLNPCYFPPDMSLVGGGGARMLRQDALTEVMAQWKGERDDGVSLDPVAIENVETVLLGHPLKIDQLLIDNLEYCKAAMSGNGMDAWQDWIVSQPRKLMEGECRRPLDSTMFWYLDIATDWQFQTNVCDENVVRITATAADEYKVDDDGPWMNAEGQADKAATGEDYPCNIEGCVVGQLVMRFRGDSGSTVIKPIGTELIFDPPEHGVIDIMVNDTTYFNNEYRVAGGIQHHTGVTYEPVQ